MLCDPFQRIFFTYFADVHQLPNDPIFYIIYFDMKLYNTYEYDVICIFFAETFGARIWPSDPI